MISAMIRFSIDRKEVWDENMIVNVTVFVVSASEGNAVCEAYTLVCVPDQNCPAEDNKELKCCLDKKIK